MLYAFGCVIYGLYLLWDCRVASCRDEGGVIIAHLIVAHLTEWINALIDRHSAHARNDSEQDTAQYKT